MRLQILTGNLIVKPFICLRLVYFCLAVFSLDSADARWNPIEGSMAALVCMALIPEFVTVLVYLWVGYRIPAQESNVEPIGQMTIESGPKIDGER